MDRRGRYELFVQQYEEYLPRVLNYVRLRVDDEAVAQDLTALTFERALSRLSTLRDEGAFGGWLFRIARNVVASYYRHRRRDLPLESAASHPVPDPSVESRIVASEELEEGKYNILIRGEARGRVIEELPGRPYRRARVEQVSPYCHQPEPAVQKLRQALQQVVGSSPFADADVRKHWVSLLKMCTEKQEMHTSCLLKE